MYSRNRVTPNEIIFTIATAIQALFDTNPLVEQEPSAQSLSASLFNDIDQKSVYMGTGLCTSKEMGQGVPFDFVGYLSTAEQARLKLGMDKTIHLIADSHAKSNAFVEPEIAERQANLFQTLVENASRKLGFKNRYNIMKASDIDTQPAYSAILEGQDPTEHEYVRRQLTDMEYLVKDKNIGLKLSWLLDPKSKKQGYDERFFDAKFAERHKDKLSFLYTAPGRTFNSDKPKASPYTTVPSESRILIEENVNLPILIEKRINENSKTARKALNHLDKVVRVFEDTFGKVNGEGLGAKIQVICRNFLE